MVTTLVVLAGIAALMATVISLYRTRKWIYARDRREAQMFWWKLEMERDFERSKEQWR